MNKFCQSCAMPLSTTNQGTDADGTLSTVYCNLCYQKGAFTNPNITFNEMVALGKKGIDESDSNLLSKFFMKLFYPSMLKKADRFSK
ncbi:hypothetical protein WOSG25_100630 [Weissella oryzae SG25]|uniref:Putative zinc ribbon domain-containing protein n=1 Tax=Weissella oryzae (strain DSM 25784 / JCM 18191 / LMG 30913 / SG25) TaxID=1329250 RepID=A0A069CVS6_WEIOS|nr:zinc ribbon domain-containing protein [Weissella oryzae]GAK31497.1 hypothetical protein WOSG25_100630 [Weissella oryzae SG25]